MRTVVGKVYSGKGREVRIETARELVRAILPAGAEEGRRWQGEIVAVTIDGNGVVDTLRLKSSVQPAPTSQPPQQKRRSSRLLYPPRPRY